MFLQHHALQFLHQKEAVLFIRAAVIYFIATILKKSFRNIWLTPGNILIKIQLLVLVKCIYGMKMERREQSLIVF
ncbi:hypothetical protein DQG13_26350 [Paenibacillus sp. YN15]|nr:hypothetical protein DQG13_26350 [Paenibacillus sp. YN15]